MHSSCIKDEKLTIDFSTKTQPIDNLKNDPNKYNLELSDEPKNISNHPELVK